MPSDPDTGSGVSDVADNRIPEIREPITRERRAVPATPSEFENDREVERNPSLREPATEYGRPLHHQPLSASVFRHPCSEALTLKRNRAIVVYLAAGLPVVPMKRSLSTARTGSRLKGSTRLRRSPYNRAV